jgi:hypothetical protein
MIFPMISAYYFIKLSAGKKNKKQKWMPIETEVISIASGTCWADEVEKEQNGNNFV